MFRQRIEHCQLLAPEDLPRFAELGVACSVQFTHAPSDRDLADEYWAGKTDGTYAFRSLLESGARLMNGSDAPIEELDRLAGVRAGVRRTIDERPAWHGDEALTVEQALHATCVTPAWLARESEPVGRSFRATTPISSCWTATRGRLRGRGRRHDGRRSLGAQPAPLGRKRICVRLTCAQSLLAVRWTCSERPLRRKRP